jgi:WD40 repeat protein
MKRYSFGMLTFAFLCFSFVWAQAPTEIKGHDGLIHSVAFSNDGKFLATASVDGTVKIWDFGTGKETQVLKSAAPGSPVNTVAFNKDGTVVATGSQDDAIRLWNPKDGKAVKELKGAHKGGVSSIAFSPDGTLLASGGADKAVKLWDVKEAKELKNLGAHKESVYSVAFNPAGTELASCGNDGVIKIWDVKGQKEIKSMMVDLPKPAVKIEPKKEEPKKDPKDKKDAKKDTKKKEMKKEAPKELRDAFTVVAFTPDGKQILSVGHDKYLRFWNIAEGKETKKLGPTKDWIFGLAVSKDGKNVATAGYGGSLRVYDIATGNEIYDDVKAKADRRYWITYCVAFSPDGKSVITGHDFKGKGVVKVTTISK